MLAVLPVVVVVALLAWQVAALLAGAMDATDRARAAALAAGAGGDSVEIVRTARVPTFLPGLGRMAVTGRVVVRGAR